MKPYPKAKAWAAKNSWFGSNQTMTYTAFAIHQKLVEQEGFDGNSDAYYIEVDKRIRDEFPLKFGGKKTDKHKYKKFIQQKEKILLYADVLVEATKLFKVKKMREMYQKKFSFQYKKRLIQGAEEGRNEIKHTLNTMSNGEFQSIKTKKYLTTTTKELEKLMSSVLTIVYITMDFGPIDKKLCKIYAKLPITTSKKLLALGRKEVSKLI
jgi:hypothetical protein|tara:strand:- start:1974 stop:2600 length:627 start_codon:yes stop_codon:yes gene_type:complete